MKLLYTGAGPVTLMTLGIEIEPGGEIDVPDPVGKQFADRPDFERLDAPEGAAEEAAESESEAGDAAPTQAPGKRKTTKAATGETPAAQPTDEPAPTA